MRSGRGAVRAFDPAGLDLGSGDGAEETEVGAGVSDMAERADECRFFGRRPRSLAAERKTSLLERNIDVSKNTLIMLF